MTLKLLTFLLFCSSQFAFAQAGDVDEIVKPARTPASLVDEPIHLQLEGLPKFELGMGITGVYLNDYPGSDQQHFRYIPMPYIVYRGDFLRSDGSGKVRGLFFNSAELDVDASVDGSFPVDGSQNRARQGMPGLDWIGEIGPRALIHLHRSPKMGIDLSIPVRWVFSTNFWTRADDRGWDFNPEIKFRHQVSFDQNGSINAVAGALWATSQLTRYFYEVRPEYVLADRPEYTAKAGFMYDYVSLVYFHESSHVDHLMYFLGTSRSFLAASANRSSPLMRSVENESFFLGLVYNFYQSEAKSHELAQAAN